MKTVFESSFAVEAHMIQHLLQGAGIDSHVLGEFLPGAAGELPPAGLVRVVVADAQESEARSIIADWERAQPATDTPPPRRAISFPATALAFVVGAVVSALTMWWVLRTPTLADEVDYDKDGVTDMRTTYAGQVPVLSGLLSSVELDTDADGVFDQTRKVDWMGEEIAQ